MDKSEVIKKVKQSEINRIKFAVADIDGILRGKYIYKDKFLDSLENGVGFCDVILGWDSNDLCYDNIELTGWHTGYPDARVQIDVNTFREIPWENATPFFLADFSDSPHKEICPRSLLKRIAGEASELGYQARYALETEWFNFTGLPQEINLNDVSQLKPITPGMFGYSMLRTSMNSSYVSELFDLLARFNVPLEGLHTETGPGVYEAAIVVDEIVAAADKAILFKSAVREIAYRHNMTATFMAKWNAKLPGCGGHIHQSIWDDKGNRNLFHSDQNKMSETLEHYIAGQLFCMPEIMPMYAPNVNSYKRIGHGDWAPATVSWGIDNRTASIRVIHGGPKASRTELRVPGADINPYLAMAASLASGLYGIKNKLKLNISPSVGNAYSDLNTKKLSSSLWEAADKMKNSTVAKELFGSQFVDHYIQTRQWEWQQFMGDVTDWELKRYFEII